MKYFTQTVVELLKESVLSQALLIGLIFCPIAYCVVIDQPVPDVLWGFGGAIIGFYFRVKIERYSIGSERK